MINIPQKDYYSNMYDIESLTDLNKDRIGKKSPKIVTIIEELIRENKCVEAENELKKFLSKSPNIPELHILQGALQIKYKLFSGIFKNNQHFDLSPKTCALRELNFYLDKPIEEIEKLMLVEKPVRESWDKIKPNPTSEEEVDNFYMETDSYVYELMAANHIVQTLYSFHVLTQKLKELKITKTLDYGAGAGTICILLKHLGYDITYADLPGKTFDFAKWRFNRRELDIPMVDLKKESINKGDFDCIISTEVVEHVVNPVRLISKFKSLLNKDDILIISESCEYVKDFASHLESNRKYSGENFIKLMKENSFKHIIKEPFIPQLIFQRV